jgi:DNA-binding NtrC family response regulator
MTRKTVLVVNADPKVEEMLSDVLKDWTIQHASDNRAVLALAENKKFDLILTGESTSGKEDLELLHKIRRLHPTHA